MLVFCCEPDLSMSLCSKVESASVAQGFGTDQIDRLVTLGSPHQAPPKASVSVPSALESAQNTSHSGLRRYPQFIYMSVFLGSSILRLWFWGCDDQGAAHAGSEAGGSDQGHPDLGDRQCTRQLPQGSGLCHGAQHHAPCICVSSSAYQ